jgi:DNA-binding Lrp family transcriptional regulator
MKLNKRDMELIKCLRSNSRATLTQISKATKIPITTLYDRLKAQQGHVIKKHTTIVNFDALGFHSRAQILFRVDPQDKPALQKHLTFHNQVNSIYRVASEYDFCIEAVFAHIKDIQEFVDNIQNQFKLTDHKTYYFTEDIKREGFFNS